MNCPNCNENTISHLQIFLNSRLIKTKCKKCGALFYCGGFVELISNIIAYLSVVYLAFYFFITQSIFSAIGIFLVFSVYHLIKVKYSKWLVVNGT